MARIYYDEDADLSQLEGKSIAIIGYGNQGRAQALNLLDSGVSIIVGTARDETWNQAKEDGFTTLTPAEACAQAEIIFLLVPDEIAPQVYEESVMRYLTPGKVLDFASGYNITYGFISPPPSVDVILLAPRMIGRSVRDLYMAGRGAPCLLGIEQDASGKALAIALALAKALGFTRAGVVESSFREETLTDLFGEQTHGGVLHLTRMAYEVMREVGISEEAALLELTLSGERAEVEKAISELGLWHQLRLHSRTSQYGQQTRGPRLATEKTRTTLREIMAEIVDGSFAREWAQEQQQGLPRFNSLWEQNLHHPYIEAEDRTRLRLRGRKS